MENLRTHCAPLGSTLRSGGQLDVRDVSEITKNIQMMEIKPSSAAYQGAHLWMMMTLGAPEGQGSKEAGP